jgi:hypothetical protein
LTKFDDEMTIFLGTFLRHLSEAVLQKVDTESTTPFNNVIIQQTLDVFGQFDVANKTEWNRNFGKDVIAVLSVLVRFFETQLHHIPTDHTYFLLLLLRVNRYRPYMGDCSWAEQDDSRKLVNGLAKFFAEQIAVFQYNSIPTSPILGQLFSDPLVTGVDEL